MARRIADRGHDVQLVTASSEIAREQTERIENFTVNWLPVPYSHHMSSRERIKAFLKFAVRASVKVGCLKADVVFATSTPLTVAIPGLAATLMRRRPFVFEVRDLWPAAPVALGVLKNPIAKRLAVILEESAYRFAEHIIALSPDMKSHIVAKGVSTNKISVITNASDNYLFEGNQSAGERFRSEHPWLLDRKLVLYCGTIGKVNDVSYIARLAAEALRLDPEIRFLVVGEGNDETQVRTTAEELGVYQKNFFMLPRVSKPAVPAIFSAADVSISTVAPIPILAANSANKVFDSFASGTPLLINHGGWLANMLKRTGAGRVLNPEDEATAATQLTNFLCSGLELREASKRAKDLAVSKFDRQLLADQLAEVLESTQNYNPHR